MIQLLWKTTGTLHTRAVEYAADLPSGGKAVVRLQGGVWIASTYVAGQRDESGMFATSYDAECAMAAAEAQRLISLGIASVRRAGLAERRRSSDQSPSTADTTRIA